MEEIIEEIEDEYDSDLPSFQKVSRVSPKELVVSARIEINNLEEELGIKIPKGKYATLAGFLLEKSGDIPLTGTVIKTQGVAFTIERSTPQAIQEVRISCFGSKM